MTVDEALRIVIEAGYEVVVPEHLGIRELYFKYSEKWENDPQAYAGAFSHDRKAYEQALCSMSDVDLEDMLSSWSDSTLADVAGSGSDLAFNKNIGARILDAANRIRGERWAAWKARRGRRQLSLGD